MLGVGPSERITGASKYLRQAGGSSPFPALVFITGSKTARHSPAILAHAKWLAYLAHAEWLATPAASHRSACARSVACGQGRRRRSPKCSARLSSKALMIAAAPSGGDGRPAVSGRGSFSGSGSSSGWHPPGPPPGRTGAAAFASAPASAISFDVKGLMPRLHHRLWAASRALADLPKARLSDCLAPFGTKIPATTSIFPALMSSLLIRL